MFSAKSLVFGALVAYASVAAANACTREYTVKAGDTCDKISAAHNVSSYQLAVENYDGIDSECHYLQIGQVLCLGREGQDCRETYVVQSKDTCEKITSVFAINSTILYENNPQINPQCTNIYVGEVLCVSSVVAAPPPPAGYDPQGVNDQPGHIQAAQPSATPAPAPTPAAPSPQAPAPTPQTPTPQTPEPDYDEEYDPEDDESLPYCDEL